MIDAFIIQAVYILDSAIINNETTISEMPAVLPSVLLLGHDEFCVQFKRGFKNDIVQASIFELGDVHIRCQVPPLDELLNVTIDEPLDWYPVFNFGKNITRTDASYKEQLFPIKMCVESINSYLDFMNTGFVKNIIIAGFPCI